MLQQVLVVAPNGICIVDRQYEKLNLDPQLLAGFLAAVVPHMDELGMTMENIHEELIGNNESFLEIFYENDFICVGIANEHDMVSEKIRQILEEVNVMVYSQFGLYDPMHYSTIPGEIYDFIEEHIDILLARKGVSTSSQRRDQNGLLPIINQVKNGKISPDRAGKMILDWLKTENLEREQIENMKNSLNFVDNMLSSMNLGKLDDLQVVIRSTVQGVSKLTVRMDDALSF